ncbi:tigger transposable element-derived protein 6-like [Rhizophagus irregularis DAOM 181602=DAOM 197198]|nr:tigger transposable element-derived protein 6-like [Rhizophagus irregularis DAOM 181602=DAOM 197198]
MPPDKKRKRKVAESTSKRESLSFTEKKELCEWKRDNPLYNQENLAKKFGISKPQVCKILKEKDKWISINISNKEFKDQKRDRGAKQINRAGEANSAPLETLEEERKILQEIIEQYDPCDIYNVDETEPSKTLSDHYISGIKKDDFPVWYYWNRTAWMQVSAQYRKLLVANRVETYDLAQESSSDVTPVDILDAITFVSKAWNIVKSSTIEHCWEKTGILPDFKGNNPEENDSDWNQDINDDINRITLELQEMIDELNLQDPITAIHETEIAERFIHIDDEIPIELLSDEEIIAAIISRPENDDIEEDDELETNISISNKEALSSLEKVVQYFKNLPDNILVDYTELKTLYALKSKINKQIQDNAKQTTLDSFMQC